MVCSFLEDHQPHSATQWVQKVSGAYEFVIALSMGAAGGRRLTPFQGVRSLPGGRSDEMKIPAEPPGSQKIWNATSRPSHRNQTREYSESTAPRPEACRRALPMPGHSGLEAIPHPWRLESRSAARPGECRAGALMYVKSSFAFMNYGLLSETRNRTHPITSFRGQIYHPICSRSSV